MCLVKVLTCCVVVSAHPAVADPFSNMTGSWNGSGWARQSPQGPKETVRCRITNTYDVATNTLAVAGRCAVPGRKLTMSGTLNGKDGAERITGRWSNPDGIGSAGIVGIQRGNIVAFNFSAIDPETGRNLSQNVEWRISGDTLLLRSTDRTNPTVAMSKIEFAR